MQGEGGIRNVPTQCLRGLRELCDEHGMLLVFDEVQTGFGRTGKLFAHEWSGIEPDIMAIAKGIGGGFPLAGLSAPGIGLSAYNGTGAEVGSFEYFHVGEPDLPPPPPCEEPYTPEPGYTMLFDGTDSSLEDWTYAGGGSFVREGCAIKSVGGFGLLYTPAFTVLLVRP